MYFAILMSMESYSLGKSGPKTVNSISFSKIFKILTEQEHNRLNFYKSYNEI